MATTKTPTYLRRYTDLPALPLACRPGNQDDRPLRLIAERHFFDGAAQLGSLHRSQRISVAQSDRGLGAINLNLSP